MLGGRASALNNSNMWLSQEDTEAVVTALEPKLERTATALERLLAEVVTLEVSLSLAADVLQV